MDTMDRMMVYPWLKSTKSGVSLNLDNECIPFTLWFFS